MKGTVMREHPNEPAASLHILLGRHASLQETLRDVAVVAVRSLDADMAGLTLLDAEGRPTTAVFTDDIAPEIDQAQYSSGRGPCLDAFRLRTVFRIDSTDHDDRWPEFAAKARANGIQSSLSLPLILEGQGIGTLNLY